MSHIFQLQITTPLSVGHLRRKTIDTMLSTVVIIAALAVSPCALASDKKFSVPVHSTKPHKTGFKYKKDSQESRAKCVGEGTATNFKLSQNAHVEAVTAAWEYACNSKVDDDWVSKVHKVWKDKDVQYDSGVAFAKAIAVAKTACDSEGHAYGCAAAYAHAKAWAEATLSAHAKAWAEAIAKCTCDEKEQQAAAGADAYAHEMRTLMAKVEAAASSHICVSGTQYESDYDAWTCIQDLYGTVFAKSISLAAIKGKCVSKNYYDDTAVEYGTYTAKALADAQAKIVVEELEGCVNYADHSIPHH